MGFTYAHQSLVGVHPYHQLADCADGPQGRPECLFRRGPDHCYSFYVGYFHV